MTRYVITARFLNRPDRFVFNVVDTAFEAHVWKCRAMANWYRNIRVTKRVLNKRRNAPTVSP